uniref:Queuine tRNA-ribosyltransferase accessory subunit 2 n=1 Tax=Tabanus bromius TaxID=304241 RepID=A0A0K8TML0_TABBR
MKFSIDVVSKLSGRAGHFVHTENGNKYLTPLLLQATKSGSVPFLTKEVFDMVSTDPQILGICLGSTQQMQEALINYAKGIAQYVGFPDALTFVCLKDPAEHVGTGYDSTKDSVPLLTRTGKVLINPERYMDIMEAFKPSMYVLLSDSDTNVDSSAKRNLRAVEKTCNFVSECVKRHRLSKTLQDSFVIAPIVGGYNKEARSKSAKQAVQMSEVGGFIIEGLHNNGLSALNVDEGSVKEIVSECISLLPEDKPRFIMGAYDPIMLLELVRLGMDVFDTSYAYLATIDFRILTFNSNLEDYSKTDVFCVDVREERYNGDFSPLLDGCRCLACVNHTKAYVNHLYKTKELLAPILLMIHNIHHYIKFFENIRQAITKGTLGNLIEIIKEQKNKQKLTENSKNIVSDGDQKKLEEVFT